MGHNADLARALAAKMPHGRAEIIPHAGHLAFLEEPEKFNKLMLDSLASK
jgi:pimeloyl-ACP methyl ester carboxylesterase